MIKSKTKIDKQLQRKTNQKIVETLRLLKKNDNWLNLASNLSGPRRKRLNINLKDLNSFIKEGDKIVIPGKILSQGEIEKKAEIIALGFSEKAKMKLKEAGCKTLNLLDGIKLYPDAKGIKFYKNENN